MKLVVVKIIFASFVVPNKRVFRIQVITLAIVRSLREPYDWRSDQRSGPNFYLLFVELTGLILYPIFCRAYGPDPYTQYFVEYTGPVHRVDGPFE